MKSFILTLSFLIVQAFSSPVFGQTTSEIGGRVIGPHGEPLGQPATVLAYTDQQCVAAADTFPGGEYMIPVPPGVYNLRVLLDNHEIGNKRVQVEAGSWQHNLRTWELPAPSIASRSNQPVNHG